MKPKVSIITITYNQEKYIKQALDSFIVQKTDFPFVVIVADDCSTDSTSEIIKEYAKKYPNIIKPILREKNIGSQENFVDAIQHCNSDYIAICDGDDYWCDENKLQKQVNFLETNPNYSICFHPMIFTYEDKSKESKIIPHQMPTNPQSLINLAKGNYIPSNSVMYRTSAFKNLFNNYPKNIYPCDWFNHIICGSNGKIGFINDAMSVYRWNSNGVSYTNSINPVQEIHLKYGIEEVNFSFAVWNNIKEIYPQYYNEVFIPTLKDVYLTYLKDLQFDKLEILNKEYSSYFKDIEICPEIKNIKNLKKKYKKYKKLFNTFLIVSIVLLIICLFLCIYLGIKYRSILG